MSDHIYPECPSCSEKASSGKGVSLREVSMGDFWWTCPNCKKRHRGYFGIASHSVHWEETREPTLRYRIYMRIRTAMS